MCRTFFTKRLVCLVLFLTLAVVLSVAENSRGQVAGNTPQTNEKKITPAGSLVMDAGTKNPAVGSLPVTFVRSPDHEAKDGGGRYLIAVNSGYGIQFSASTNRGQQSIAVVDLNAQLGPQVIQNVYFPTPQSANVGTAFSPMPDANGGYILYVSGGFENRIWMFQFRPGEPAPVDPPSPGPETRVKAPFISVAGFATTAPSPRYNESNDTARPLDYENNEPVYPTGIAIAPDGNTLFIANNLGDSLGIIHDLRNERKLTRIDLSDGQPGHFVYPYAVTPLRSRDGRSVTKVYVSCWSMASIAVADPRHPNRPITRISVGRHPTSMILNSAATRLYVVNSDADSVSVINTATDKVVETIGVRLTEKSLPGDSPEDLALSPDGSSLYVANAHSNAVAVVDLSPAARGVAAPAMRGKDKNHDDDQPTARSKVRGFIPTGYYPSAITVANGLLFIGNGKGTGFESSSMVVSNKGFTPKLPNERFPVGTSREKQGGQYDVSLIAGNFSMLPAPDARSLADFTQQVMRNEGLLGLIDVKLFPGPTPIHHVIYVIKENRSYDQIFGDLQRAGNGEPADGDPSLAIFGAGAAAQRPGGPPQNISPNTRALALRFGLLDRFFVNSEASPDGHNWATAAYSSDYVDKAFRWSYSYRGRAYDYQGTNRLPNVWPMKNQPPALPVPATAADIEKFMRRFVPYLNGSRDIGEPSTLFLWDDAARAGLTYRAYGEGVVSFSQGQVDDFNANNSRRKYPDVTSTAVVFPVRKGLEGHASPTYREFDLFTPDAITIDSYKAAKESNGKIDPLISPTNSDERFRGYSRLADWLQDFHRIVAARDGGKGDSLPSMTVLYLPNDHTNGIRAGTPSPQFYVAENDYAVGRLVQEVSSSSYWKDTAILILEDDAQDGPDHVDAHRSPALVISAYNRPGALVHQYHDTVSLIRTMEVLLGMPPMNQLDASAAPIDIFRPEADLRPYQAVLPDVASDNFLLPQARDAETAHWMKETEKQDLTAADMADPQVLNQIIWFSVRGKDSPMPPVARLPVYDAMRAELDEDASEEAVLIRDLKHLLARR
jgi:YVTN family beta-propeller protein